MKIVVIIPCRNEVNHIQECVDAIFKSKLEVSCELSVIVVDGKSDDGTTDLIQELKLKYYNLSVVINEKQLTPFAFNIGINELEADYYQIIGARQIIDEFYISKAVSRLENDKTIWCVGGSVQNVYLNECGRIIATAMSTSFGMGLGNFRTLEKSDFVDTVGTPMYPKFVFDKIGFFDEELVRNQDDDFNFRLIQAGGKIFFDANISLKYYVRGSFPNLWKQFFQYGYWKVYVNQKHKTVTTFRQLVPPIFVLYLIVFILSWFFGTFIGIISSFPIIFYLILASYISYNLTSKDTLLRFKDIFKTFLILHISYGLGYLRGVLEFVLMKKKPSDKQKKMSR